MLLITESQLPFRKDVTDMVASLLISSESLSSFSRILSTLSVVSEAVVVISGPEGVVIVISPFKDDSGRGVWSFAATLKNPVISLFDSLDRVDFRYPGLFPAPRR